MIKGIEIVSIPVRDQNASLKFYTEKLGFKYSQTSLLQISSDGSSC